MTRRIHNDTITADNIRAIREQLKLLLEGIQLIEFELERHEQAALYSILRHMEWEIMGRDGYNIDLARCDTPVQNQRLQELLARISRDAGPGDA